MTASDHLNDCGPQNAYSPLLLAYDLRSGKEVASLRLTGVPAGNWTTNRTVNGEIVEENWQPGFALSPDGSQLVVLDGQTNTLILLQASTLRIVGREELTRPETAVQPVAALLGLVPEMAEAKGEIEGVSLQMQYTPDGHSLLVTGFRLRPSRRHLYSSSQSLRIRLFDLASGRIKARLDDGKTIESIWTAPDGKAVYSAVGGWRRPTGWFTILRRHDPTTLQIRARRTFLHTSPLSLFFLQ
jgi:WD40 repeat protein